MSIQKQNETKLNEDEINEIKHKLPFLIRINYQEFLDNYYKLITNVKQIPYLLKIDLFYTIFSLKRVDLWYNFLKIIYEYLNLEHKIELTKLASFHKTIVIDKLIPLYDDIINHALKENKNNYEKIEFSIYNLSFFDMDFFKPTLTTHFKNFRTLPDEVIYYLTKLALEYIKDINKLIDIYERVISIRNLTNDEKENILKISKNENLKIQSIGKLIDVLLRSEDEKLFIEAITLMEKTSNHLKNDLLKEQAVHYYEISPEFINLVNNFIVYNGIRKGITGIIEDFMSFVKLYSYGKFKKTVMNILNLIIASKYKDKISLEDTFTFIWYNLTEEQKIILIKEMNTYEDICSSGLLINLIIFYGGFVGKTFISENQSFKEHEEIILKLKEKYPEDDDFWMNPEGIEKEIKTYKIK